MQQTFKFAMAGTSDDMVIAETPRRTQNRNINENVHEAQTSTNSLLTGEKNGKQVAMFDDQHIKHRGTIGVAKQSIKRQFREEYPRTTSRDCLLRISRSRSCASRFICI